MIDDFNDEDKIVSNSNLWDYKDEGNTIIGFVVEINEEGTYGREIVVDNGDEQKTIPSLTALNTKLSHAKVGDKIKIVSLGKVRSMNKKEYWDFEVFIKSTEEEEGPKEVMSKEM